ncbi:hypothetical protein U1Q18_009078 [Sarracenia purpurea var. burkii]
MDYEPRFAFNFNLWTRFAAVNGIKELHLKLHHRVPDQLYENDCYVLLQFCLPTHRSGNYVFLCAASCLQGFPEILELYHFYGVNRLHITSASVKKIILEECWIEMSDHLNSELEISMPNLQSLEILGCFEELDCRLVDVTSLVEVILDFELNSVR